MVTVGISISAFSSLIGIPIGITSSSVGLKICATTAGIKNYKSIIKKKEKKHDKIVLLNKLNSIVKCYKLNNIEVVISRVLIDSYISHDQFILEKNMLKEYDQTNEEIKNTNNR